MAINWDEVLKGGGMAAGGYAALQEIQGLLDALRGDITTGAERIGREAQEGMEFKPYTVTSGLGTFTTTPEGGLDFTLSDEGLAQQQARFAEAETLFGRAMADPTQQINQLYEDIRAVQRPEERRQQRALEQSLFSTGRGGISTAEYGGTREEFMSEKARQEAMNTAALAARQSVQQQQAQDLQSAASLMGLGYTPQTQALSLFQQSQIPAQLAQQARTGGSELMAQIGLTGLEGLMGLGQAETEATASLFANLLKAVGNLDFTS